MSLLEKKGGGKNKIKYTRRVAVKAGQQYASAASKERKAK